MAIRSRELPHYPQYESEPIAGKEDRVYEVLELQNWAPWLRFSPEALKEQSEIFPAGQFMLMDREHRPLAALSTTRTHWDGSPNNLPTWDELASPDMTFKDSYNANGNTLALMSTSIRSDAKGRRLSDVLIDEAKHLARSQGMTHLIGDFRPSGYGTYKATEGYVDMATYFHQGRRLEDGLSVDPWLRSLEYKGVDFIKIDPKAMVVPVGLDEFENFRNEHMEHRWYEVKRPAFVEAKIEEHKPFEELSQIDEVWECHEAGTWYIDKAAAKAVYIESNIWGELPLN